MKQLFITSSAAVGIFALLTFGISPGDGYPSGANILVGFFFWPALALAILLTLVGVVRLFARDTRSTGVAAILFCLPMLLRYSYLHAKDVAKNREYDWSDTSRIIAQNLLEYHRLYPDRFHYVGTDETVSVEGFTAWLHQLGTAAIPPGEPAQFRFRDDYLIDPWGNPIIFALDRNHDGYIDFRGYHETVSGVELPFPSGFTYTDAVAVDSSHYQGEYSSARVKYR